jgi:hypothetical protein
VPAAAVIPAPIAYTKVVAVKKLVVGSWSVCLRSHFGVYCLTCSSIWLRVCVLLTECRIRPKRLP